MSKKRAAALKARRAPVEVNIGIPENLTIKQAVEAFRRVEVSTARRAGTAPAKTLPMISKTLRVHWRTQLCAHCGKAPAIEPQHFPTTGSNGVEIDLLSYPTCRKCHIRCDMAERNGGFTRADKALAFHSAWEALARRYPTVLRLVLAELAESGR
jgi:hypothetical protein